MKLTSVVPICVYLLFGCSDSASQKALGQERPQIIDQRLQLELFAEAPNIVTPIGVIFDHKGRLLVIESHTHKREGNYSGPEKDRIRIIEDTNNDGIADLFRTFYEGTTFTMSLALGSDGWIYVATRAKVFRIRDTDGDDRADEEQVIVHLDTKGVYPHNGLSGLVLDRHGHLYFGMGENLGFDYRLIGSDGAAQRGSGEGGIFRCDLDGKNLARIATGFWNPFGICIDSEDRIFAVGNDSDGRPPCRLVHVFEAADYGFQFRYGRSGRHPLQAWDGELPGTLPMVAGTGEAPCEIVVYNGRLWVASWGDNQIERYELLPTGASFRARREIVVQGDKSFRPVGFAESPDGSLYFTDWVDRSYPVHGQGRIWRLSFKSATTEKMPSRSEAENTARQAAQTVDLQALKSSDVFLRQAAVAGLARSDALRTIHMAQLRDPRQKLGYLQALRWQMDHSRDTPEAPPLDTLKQALRNDDPDVRLYAIRWVADAEIKELQQVVRDQMSHPNITPELYLASIATLELLESGNTNLNAYVTDRYLVESLTNSESPRKLRTTALRMISRDNKQLELPALRKLIDGDDSLLQREAVRWLALSARLDRTETLLSLANDQDRPPSMRADALLGIADRDAQLKVLTQLTNSTNQSIQREAAQHVRAIEDQQPTYNHPDVTDLDAWLRIIGDSGDSGDGRDGGDADAGWRVFFGEGSARCANCHRYESRGENIGPELTAIAARTSRRDVLQSILQPSRDIAPQYVPMVLETADGRSLQGLHQGYDRFLAADGTIFRLKESQIETRRMSKVSIMPDGLHHQLSINDIRNLLALLSRE